MTAAHTANAISHFDIAGPDLPALKGFYGALFGWRVDEKGPGYALVTTPADSPNGALIEAQASSLTIGIAVPDLDAALVAAKGQGGSVVMPATDNGWVKKAQVSDPAGNVVTLIQA